MKYNSIRKIKSYDLFFKVIFIGDYGCGKSSVLIRYDEKIYHEYAYTAGRFDFKFHMLKVLGKVIEMQIWDCQVDSRFRNFPASHFWRSDGLFIVFDVTNRESFISINKWFENARSYGDPNASAILIGNKCDLEDERQVSYDEAKELADNLNIIYIEISAKSNKNIEEAFNILVFLMIDVKINRINLN